MVSLYQILTKLKVQTVVLLIKEMPYDFTKFSGYHRCFGIEPF